MNIQNKLDLTITELQMLKSMTKNFEDETKSDILVTENDFTPGQFVRISFNIENENRKETVTYSVEAYTDLELYRLVEERNIITGDERLKVSVLGQDTEKSQYTKTKIQKIREYQLTKNNTVIAYGVTTKQTTREDAYGRTSDNIDEYASVDEALANKNGNVLVEKQDFSLFVSPEMTTILTDIEATFCPVEKSQKLIKK